MHPMFCVVRPCCLPDTELEVAGPFATQAAADAYGVSRYGETCAWASAPLSKGDPEVFVLADGEELDRVSAEREATEIAAEMKGIVESSLKGYWLDRLHELGCDALLCQDLRLTIPGDESTVVYPASTIIAEIRRHIQQMDGDELEDILELLGALETLTPDTQIFI